MSEGLEDLRLRIKKLSGELEHLDIDTTELGTQGKRDTCTLA